MKSLEQLSYYLPYKLNMYGASDITTLRGIVQYNDCIELHLSHPVFGNVTGDIIEHTPLVRPLSDITKKINHNGKEFVPAMVIWDISASEEEEYEVYGTIPEYWQNAMKLSFPNDLTFRDARVLFSLHFDLFLWIDKGMALNINKLNK